MPSPFFGSLLRETASMTPTLKTERLVLRAFRMEEAVVVCALAGNWNVARMLTRVPHPYTRELAESWIASHAADWRRGDELVFCVEFGGAPVGAISLRRKEDGVYVLGYWFGEAWWGRGLASEAARSVVRFAFEDLEAEKLISGHFTDNPASGRVLEKCGFRYTGESMEASMARGEAVAHRNFECGRDRADRS